jgi:putative oxidoreductase
LSIYRLGRRHFAILVIAGIWKETLAAWGGLLIIVTMSGAIFTHIKVKDNVKQMMMPISLLNFRIGSVINKLWVFIWLDC